MGCCFLKEKKKNTQTQTSKPSLSHAYAFTLSGFPAISQGFAVCPLRLQHMEVMQDEKKLSTG